MTDSILNLLNKRLFSSIIYQNRNVRGMSEFTHKKKGVTKFFTFLGGFDSRYLFV